MKFANEIDLSVARDAIFAFVADQRNIPLWNYYVLDVRQERGDGPAVGARYVQRRKTDSHHTAITGMEPGERLTVETVEGAPVFRRHIEFRQTRRGTRQIDFAVSRDIGRGLARHRRRGTAATHGGRPARFRHDATAEPVSCPAAVIRRYVPRTHSTSRADLEAD